MQLAGQRIVYYAPSELVLTPLDLRRAMLPFAPLEFHRSVVVAHVMLLPGPMMSVCALAPLTPSEVPGFVKFSLCVSLRPRQSVVACSNYSGGLCSRSPFFSPLGVAPLCLLSQFETCSSAVSVVVFNNRMGISAHVRVAIS